VVAFRYALGLQHSPRPDGGKLETSRVEILEASCHRTGLIGRAETEWGLEDFIQDSITSIRLTVLGNMVLAQQTP
jgi:hypothetical protein